MFQLKFNVTGLSNWGCYRRRQGGVAVTHIDCANFQPSALCGVKVFVAGWNSTSCFTIKHPQHKVFNDNCTLHNTTVFFRWAWTDIKWTSYEFIFKHEVTKKTKTCLQCLSSISLPTFKRGWCLFVVGVKEFIAALLTVVWGPQIMDIKYASSYTLYVTTKPNSRHHSKCWL